MAVIVVWPRAKRFRGRMKGREDNASFAIPSSVSPQAFEGAPLCHKELEI